MGQNTFEAREETSSRLRAIAADPDALAWIVPVWYSSEVLIDNLERWETGHPQCEYCTSTVLYTVILFIVGAFVRVHVRARTSTSYCAGTVL